MPPLSPPAYPHRPEAPLLSFGPVFSEYISHCTIPCVWSDKNEHTHHANLRVAAGLTMLEGFHPRDHLECMLASMGVAFFAAEMECLAKAMEAETPLADACKLRASAAQMHRCFSRNLVDMAKLQARKLPGDPVDDLDGPPSGPTSRKPRTTGARSSAKKSATPPPAQWEDREDTVPPPAPGAFEDNDELPELPDPTDDFDLEQEMEIRADGTPGSLRAYAPEPPEPEVVPGESALMFALGMRPKEYYQVNVPPDQTAEPGDARPPEIQNATVRPSLDMRMPLNLNERYPVGETLTNVVNARYDPTAQMTPMVFEDNSTVELELISTGGDPEMEAERQALIEAHPEGKPIRVIRLAGRGPAHEPPKKPPD